MKGIFARIVTDGKVTRKIVIVEDRKCEFCGNQFTPKTLKSLYCSRECCKKAENKRNADAYKERSKKYYRDHIEKVKEKRKTRYHSNPELYKQQSAEWYRNNKKRALAWHQENKDKKRHGGIKKKLIKENGKVCSKCGKITDGKDLHAHHVTFNSKDHEKQILVCNSCHGKIHITTSPFLKK